MTIELKSDHLWPLVERFTADAPRAPEMDEDGNVINSFGVPDWVARAMLDDIRQLQAEVQRLEAELAATLTDLIEHRNVAGLRTATETARLRELRGGES